MVSNFYYIFLLAGGAWALVSWAAAARYLMVYENMLQHCFESTLPFILFWTPILAYENPINSACSQKRYFLFLII